MKKIAALMLAFVLLLGMTNAHAAKEGKYDKLTVGVTTPFRGNFLDDALGSNLVDQDVRSLIHGYNLVKWNADEGKFELDQTVVTGGASTEDTMTYIRRPDLQRRYADHGQGLCFQPAAAGLRRTEGSGRRTGEPRPDSRRQQLPGRQGQLPGRIPPDG